MLSEASPPGQIRRAWQENRFTLIYTNQQLTELRRVLSRPRIRDSYSLSTQDIDLLLLRVEARGVLVSGTSAPPILVRDPSDTHILAAALEGEADYLVSGDRDLLVLAEDPRVGPLKVITPAEFLAILSSADTCP